MLLRVGVMKKRSDAAPEMVENAMLDRCSLVANPDIVSSPKSGKVSQKKKGSSKALGMSYHDPLQLARELILNAIVGSNNFSMPRLSKHSEPIIKMAEKVLVRSEVIRRKRDLRYEDYVRAGRGVKAESRKVRLLPLRQVGK